MGMEHNVTFPTGVPRWAKVVDFLGKRGFVLQVRMIDNELALPEEQPAEDWRDLRVSTPAGMITLRKSGAAIAVVTWGNADDAMRKAWNTLAWALAEVGKGKVGAEEAEVFRQSAGLE